MTETEKALEALAFRRAKIEFSNNYWYRQDNHLVYFAKASGDESWVDVFISKHTLNEHTVRGQWILSNSLNDNLFDFESALEVQCFIMEMREKHPVPTE